MRHLLIAFLISLSLFGQNTEEELLHSITPYAIRLGDGPEKIYAFIDPLCPKSQEYIKHIFNDKKLQKQSSFYLFLYELPSLHSEFLITYIYQSKNPLEALEEIMIYEEYDIQEEPMHTQTRAMTSQIKQVAQKVQVTHRPYLFIFEKDEFD